MTEQQPEAPAVPGVTRWQVRGPVLIDAIQWTGENEPDIAAFVGDAGTFEVKVGGFAVVWNRTTGECTNLAIGYWIVLGVTGIFFGRSADDFASTYEPAPDPLVLPAGEFSLVRMLAERTGLAEPSGDAPKPPAAIVAPAEGITAKSHRPGPKRMIGREAVQHCYGCGARWPCEGSWQLRAEAAEGKLAETERQLEHAREAAAGSHEGIRLWMLDCSRIAGKHRDRAEAAQAKLDALTPKPLTAAELARLDRTISEYGDAVTAVRRALELAGTCARTDEEGRVAVAAWEALKVLSGEEGDHDGA